MFAGPAACGPMLTPPRARSPGRSRTSPAADGAAPRGPLCYELGFGSGSRSRGVGESGRSAAGPPGSSGPIRRALRASGERPSLIPPARPGCLTRFIHDDGLNIVKRKELMKRLARIAGDRREALTLTEGGSHTQVQIGNRHLCSSPLGNQRAHR